MANEWEELVNILYSINGNHGHITCNHILVPTYDISQAINDIDSLRFAHQALLQDMSKRLTKEIERDMLKGIFIKHGQQRISGISQST